MLSLSNVNQYQCVRMGVSSDCSMLNSYVWGHAIESRSSELFPLCSCHFFILHNTKNHYNKVLYFPKIYNRTSSYGPIASAVSVDPTSQVRSSAMLVLPIVGN
jgi:hypothetical protein